MPRIFLCGVLLNHRVGTECEGAVGRNVFRVLAGAARPAAEVRSAARRSVRVCDLHDSHAMVFTLALAKVIGESMAVVGVDFGWS